MKYGHTIRSNNIPPRFQSPSRIQAGSPTQTWSWYQLVLNFCRMQFVPIKTYFKVSQIKKSSNVMTGEVEG